MHDSCPEHQAADMHASSHEGMFQEMIGSLNGNIPNLKEQEHPSSPNGRWAYLCLQITPELPHRQHRSHLASSNHQAIDLLPIASQHPCPSVQDEASSRAAPGRPIRRYMPEGIGTLVTKFFSIWCRSYTKRVHHQNDCTAHAATAVPAFKLRR